jgi:hypothetical protein
MHGEHQLAVKNILTDEQVMKLQQRRQFAKRNGMHGKGSFHGSDGHRGNRGNRGSRGAGNGQGYRGI